jgi:hypothetical protein
MLRKRQERLMTTQGGAENDRTLAGNVGRFSILPASVCDYCVDGVEAEKMKTRYIADDGTAFDTKEECQQYETENALSNYDKEWGKSIPLKERAHKVRGSWRSQSRRALSDEYLLSENRPTRASNPKYIAGEFDYGIVYMRDDAVEILLKYIERLGA